MIFSFSRITRISRIQHRKTMPMASYSLRELKWSAKARSSEELKFLPSQATLSYRVGAACYPVCNIPAGTYKQSAYAPCNPSNPREVNKTLVVHKYPNKSVIFAAWLSFVETTRSKTNLYSISDAMGLTTLWVLHEAHTRCRPLVNAFTMDMNLPILWRVA